MAKIRDLAISDIFKINKLISFLDVKKSPIDEFFVPYPLSLLYRLCPMRIKVIPESLVLIEQKNIKAYINIKKAHGNYKKWSISKLFMCENGYEAGLLLVQYIVTKLGAKGANTFLAAVDETQNDLIKLFVDGAGFRNCSRQQIWKCSNIQTHISDFSGLCVRPFKNSDSGAVANLYNDNILTHFRPSLAKSKKEFQERILHGLTDSNEFKYIVENRAEKLIIGYFTLKTSDNKNYLLDLTLNKGYEHIFERVLNYSLKLAEKRTKDVNFYVLNKYYTQNATTFENTLKELGYQPTTSSVMLVKDLFRTVKDENFIKEAMLYTDINSNPAFH